MFSHNFDLRPSERTIDTSSNLIYATTHSIITVLDLRTMRVLQSMQNPRHYGPVTCLCIDKKRSWFVVGTAMGVISLWDRRFGLLLRSWRVGQGLSGPPPAVHQCMLHPSKGRGKWIVIALEGRPVGGGSTTLLEVWNVETAALMETFTTSTDGASPELNNDALPSSAAMEADISPAAAIAALVRARRQGAVASTDFMLPGLASPVLTQKNISSIPPSPTIRCMVAGSEFGGHQMGSRLDAVESIAGSMSNRTSSRGFLITGSEDSRVRLWDLGKLERTTILCGPDNDQDRPSYRYVLQNSFIFILQLTSMVQCSWCSRFRPG